jgi:hypothetical protein
MEHGTPHIEQYLYLENYCNFYPHVLVELNWIWPISLLYLHFVHLHILIYMYLKSVYVCMHVVGGADLSKLPDGDWLWLKHGVYKR